jgi:F0F1-type ATP synthase membrane subunit c/vacuolar-type H+-ATPase subunit K
MRKAKYIGLVLPAYALAFWMFYSGTFIHRQAFDKAVVAYARNPTPENEAALQRERHINHQILLHDSTTGAAIAVGLGCAVWAVARGVKPKR